MKNYNQIIETIIAETKAGSIKSVQACRRRIEELCNENNQAGNMFSIASVFGVA